MEFLLMLACSSWSDHCRDATWKNLVKTLFCLFMEGSFGLNFFAANDDIPFLVFEIFILWLCSDCLLYTSPQFFHLKTASVILGTSDSFWDLLWLYIVSFALHAPFTLSGNGVTKSSYVYTTWQSYLNLVFYNQIPKASALLSGAV